MNTKETKEPNAEKCKICLLELGLLCLKTYYRSWFLLKTPIFPLEAYIADHTSSPSRYLVSMATPQTPPSSTNCYDSKVFYITLLSCLFLNLTSIL